MVRRRASIAAGLALAFTAACGGGGSGSDGPAATVERYAVGGTVTGLTGAGLVLQNGGADDLVVNGNGPFHFPTPVDDGAPYAVTVKTQPPGQTCGVSAGTGVVSGAAVTTVSITCGGSAYRVGGTVNGLAGPGLVLQANGADDLALDADGAFTFATPIPAGGAYAVTVKAQPPGKVCTVAGGTGTIAGADVRTVAVSCVSTFRVGGTASGLSGPGLVLQDNGADDLAVDADGAFTFATPVPSGAGYSVTVKAEPPGQRCTVSGGAGTATADVTTVAVSCVTRTFTVGGSASGLAGPGLVLQNAGGDDLPVDADGAFTFSTPLAHGATYAVTIGAQPPGRHCTVGNGGGTVTGNVDTVTVSCAPLAYAVGGSASGLGGPGLVLRNNGGDDLAVDADGAFTFATALAAGASYAVTIRTEPPGLRCTVTGGAGTVPAAAVTTVVVTCAPATYTIGGTVSGLTGILVLQDNGGDDLLVDADGAFTFATALAAGAPYAVTVRTQPLGQLCAVTGGTGNVAGADVTSAAVACAPAAFRVGGLVSGLTATGLALLDNGGDGLAIDADGAFTFATPVPNGGTYAVTVSTQPAGQRCTVSSGGGTIAGADVATVRVTCAAADSFVVSGTVTGLPGPGLVLRDNGGDDLAIDADGAFTFAAPVADGAPYAVTVATSPARTRCAVANGAGTVAGGDVTSVAVTCHHWTLPAPVRTGGGTASAPALAFGPTGDAVAVWIEVESATTSHVYAASYAGASGTWGAATRIDHPDEHGNASAPDLALDGWAGDAVVVWAQDDAGGTPHVWANRLVSGAWGTAQRVDGGALAVTSPPRVAVDLFPGNAFVVWSQANGAFEDVWAARHPSPLFGGTGWEPVAIGSSEGPGASPRTAAPSNIGLASWLRTDGAGTHVIAARWTGSARWTGVNAPVRLDTADADAAAPELAADDAGNAFVTWHQADPANAALQRVWATRFETGTGTWGAPTRLDLGPSSSRLADVAIDGVAHPAGPNAFAVWRAAGSASVHAARYDRAGDAWSAPATIGGGVSDPGAKLLSVDADAGGNALAVWHDGARIRGNHFSAGVGWDGELALDTAAAATAPVVRFDGAGNAVALWIEEAGGAWRVMSARFR